MTLDNTPGISESSATRCPHLKEVQCDLEIGHIYNVSQHSSLKNEEKQCLIIVKHLDPLVVYGYDQEF